MKKETKLVVEKKLLSHFQLNLSLPYLHLYLTSPTEVSFLLSIRRRFRISLFSQSPDFLNFQVQIQWLKFFPFFCIYFCYFVYVFQTSTKSQYRGSAIEGRAKENADTHSYHVTFFCSVRYINKTKKNCQTAQSRKNESSNRKW